MAELLYRLGTFAARRAWLVISAWLVVLAVAGAAFGTFGGTLSTAISTPGTPTAQVTDRLEAESSDAAGGQATVVLHTDDGAEFTESQREEFTEVFEEVEATEGVRSVVDPFATQEQIAGQQAQVEAAREQLEAQAEQLPSESEELEAQREQLELGAEQLELVSRSEERRVGRGRGGRSAR